MQENPNEKLKSYIIDRTRYITNDCRTFLWARFQYYPDIQNSHLEIGGGNILIAMGLFGVLGYLSKIYVLLADKARYSDPKCGKPRVNETEAFKDFIKNCPYKLNLDQLRDEDLRKLWNRWRNKLAHLLVQKEGTAEAFVADKVNLALAGKYEEVKDSLRANVDIKIFTFNSAEDWWHCNVDLLASELDKIADWLASFSSSVSPERIQKALEEIESD